MDPLPAFAQCIVSRDGNLWVREAHLDDAITQEVSLEEAPAVLDRIVRGETQGRTVVRIAG